MSWRGQTRRNDGVQTSFASYLQDRSDRALGHAVGHVAHPDAKGMVKRRRRIEDLAEARRLAKEDDYGV